jgi:hypothetical protein
MREALLEHIDQGGSDDLKDFVVDGARLLRETDASRKGYYGPPQA